MFLHFIRSTEIAFILAKWILPTLLTDFQTLKDRQFSLCHFSYIHNLQNKMYSFRINNEIPIYKIRLCAQLRSIWVRIRVLVGFISFILSNFVFTFFVSVLWCPLEVFDFWVNTIFGYLVILLPLCFIHILFMFLVNIQVFTLIFSDHLPGKWH
jgi:hypothetical protein